MLHCVVGIWMAGTLYFRPRLRRTISSSYVSQRSLCWVSICERVSTTFLCLLDVLLYRYSYSFLDDIL
ncbi:hypothetical protein E4T43_01938 [Aureobasidium subglaciale]|nr:hypothetical protein E4T43_01938 [Aureobasidium subglaciale]